MSEEPSDAELILAALAESGGQAELLFVVYPSGRAVLRTQHSPQEVVQYLLAMAESLNGEYQGRDDWT